MTSETQSTMNRKSVAHLHRLIVGRRRVAAEQRLQPRPARAPRRSQPGPSCSRATMACAAGDEVSTPSVNGTAATCPSGATFGVPTPTHPRARGQRGPQPAIGALPGAPTQIRARIGDHQGGRLAGRAEMGLDRHCRAYRGVGRWQCPQIVVRGREGEGEGASGTSSTRVATKVLPGCATIAMPTLSQKPAAATPPVPAGTRPLATGRGCEGHSNALPHSRTTAGTSVRPPSSITATATATEGPMARNIGERVRPIRAIAAITVAALEEIASPTRVTASTIASRWRQPRSQPLAVAGEQEDAVVGAGAEEHHADELVGDIAMRHPVRVCAERSSPARARCRRRCRCTPAAPAPPAVPGTRLPRITSSSTTQASRVGVTPPLVIPARASSSAWYTSPRPVISIAAPGGSCGRMPPSARRR